MSKAIFRASALMDGVMRRGQRMSVSPSDVRKRLLAECLPLFAEMRDLAANWFGKQVQFIFAAVEEYENAIRTLSEAGDGQIEEDRRAADGPCVVCGTAITVMKDYGLVFCRTCDEPFMAAYKKLDSSDGFATWLI